MLDYQLMTDAQRAAWSKSLREQALIHLMKSYRGPK